MDAPPSSGEAIAADDDEQAQKIRALLRRFWREQTADLENLEADAEADFKAHNDLPLARIKRIMKSDEDVRMISAEAPVVLARACELFVLELTLRAAKGQENEKVITR